MHKIRSAHSKLVRYVRSTLHLSQAGLARKLWVDQSTVSRMEQGKLLPKHTWLKQMEKLTGLSVSVLTCRAMGMASEAVNPEATVRPTAERWRQLGTEELRIIRFRLSENVKHLRQSVTRMENALLSAEMQGEVGRAAAEVLRLQVHHQQTIGALVGHQLPPETREYFLKQNTHLQESLKRQLLTNACTTALDLAGQELEIEACRNAIVHHESQIALIEAALEQRAATAAAEKAVIAELQEGDNAPVEPVQKRYKQLPAPVFAGNGNPFTEKSVASGLLIRTCSPCQPVLIHSSG